MPARVSQSKPVARIEFGHVLAEGQNVTDFSQRLRTTTYYTHQDQIDAGQLVLDIPITSGEVVVSVNKPAKNSESSELTKEVISIPMFFGQCSVEQTVYELKTS